MVGPRNTSYDATEDTDVLASGEEDFVPEIDGPEDEDDDEVEADDEDTDEDDESLDASEEDGESEEESDEGEEEDDDSEEEIAPIDPPANWPQQEQAFFKELPPQLQHAYLDRARHMMADYTRKTQEIARARQGIADIERAISPHVQKWALNGMGPSQAIQQLIALSDFATTRPQEFIEYFANLRGIDLNAVVQKDQQPDEYIDPQVAVLRQQLAGVQAQMNQTMQAQQYAQQVAQQQQYVQAYELTNGNIENFASQTGQDGQPLYPYFNDLEEDMAAELNSGRAQTLHEAYERAKWANPYTRSKLLARVRTRDNAVNRRRAEEARRAASSLSGASSSYGAPATENMNIRELLEATSSGLI
jgi:hypothetical protein